MHIYDLQWNPFLIETCFIDGVENQESLDLDFWQLFSLVRLLEWE